MTAASDSSPSGPPPSVGGVEDDPSALGEFYRLALLSRAIHTKGSRWRESQEWPVPPRLHSTTDPGLPELAASLALRRRKDGTGDLIAPDPARPAPLLAMGVAPTSFFQALLGRPTSSTSGWDVSLSGTDLDLGVLGSVPLPGGMLQVMAGATLATSLAGTDRVGLVVSPPGSTAAGAWHEGINLAAVRRTPLVVLCHAPRPSAGAAETRLESLLDRCAGYGVKGWQAPADQPEEIWQETRRAVSEARSGGGVQLLELTGKPLDSESRLAGLLSDVRQRLVSAEGHWPQEVERWETELPDQVEAAWQRALNEPPPRHPGSDAILDHRGHPGPLERPGPRQDRKPSTESVSPVPEAL